MEQSPNPKLQEKSEKIKLFSRVKHKSVDLTSASRQQNSTTTTDHFK